MIQYMAKKRTETCPLAESFGRNLARLRKKHNLTQHELAQKVNLSRGMITYYETLARNPTLDTVYRIAKFFEVDPEELIKEDGYTPKEPPQSKLEKCVEKFEKLSAHKKKNVMHLWEVVLDSVG
jgi:transcriptional regulator with XRE-family HTH domain